jgi:hypothetical protein
MDLFNGRSRRRTGGRWDWTTGRDGHSQRPAQSRNLRTRLGLSAGQALKFRLGFADRLGEKVLLIAASQAKESYTADTVGGSSLRVDSPVLQGQEAAGGMVGVRIRKNRVARQRTLERSSKRGLKDLDWRKAMTFARASG